MIRNFYRWSLSILAGSILVLFSTTLSAQGNQVPDDIEFQALKDIYDSMGGSGWTQTTYWPTSASWPANYISASYGVYIENGDITRLNLQSCNLTGKIPASISKLAKLQYIHMFANKITGPLPSTLGNLPNLQYLYLNQNQLTGSIPASLGNLANLKLLHLNHNQLSGAIPAELSALSNVTSFGVAYNKLSGEIPDLSGMTSLTSLVLQNNLYTAGPVPLWVTNLHNLKGLHLAYTNRTGPVPEAIATMTTLAALDLSYNQLTSTIPSSLSNLVNLTSLNISSNQLSGAIPASLGNLNKLTMLNLSINQLTGEVPDELGDLSVLTYFNLASNKLTGSIPSSLGNLANLLTLSLNNNQLSGAIPSSIGNLTKLNYLYVQANQLSGELPSSLGSLTKLVNIYANNNQFSGRLPELGNLTALTNLNLSTNQLTGNIPESFSGMSQLVTCYLRFNKLSGVVPDIFGGLPKLAILELGYNNFSGSFPSSIGSCPKMTFLRGDFNSFSGLPGSLLNLPLLNYVNFENNELAAIPNFAGHINKAALTLYLRNNQLDFSHLQPLAGAGIASLLYNPQKNIKDITRLALPGGSPLIIPGRPVTATITMTWEKQSGTTWSSINAQNEDASGQTFKKSSTTASDAGFYRWRMTNSAMAGVVIQSDPIEVTDSDPLPVVAMPPALYNGLITSVYWRTDKAYGEEKDLAGVYRYTYDEKYQVKDAHYSDVNYVLRTITPVSNAFRVTGMAYDPNGNIQSLRRYDQNGFRTNNFTYGYEANKNKLTSVSGYVNAYTYNAIGQMIGEDKVTGDDQYVVYDVTGKVTTVYSDIAKTVKKVEFLYDDRGFRLAKVNLQTNRTTWYIRDASGNVINIYEQEGVPGENNMNPLVEVEVPIYGSGKLGTYYPNQDGSTAYEVTDHLGNVRALVRENVIEYTATMEDNGQANITNPRVQEMNYFRNIFETEVDDVHMNHTPPTATVVPNPSKSAYLFWQSGMVGMDAADKAIGPAIALKVTPGDTIKAETYVRYENKTSYSRSGFTLSVLSALLGNSFAYMEGFEGSTLAQTTQKFSDALTVGGFLGDTGDDIRPYAYLNYIVFDQSMTRLASDWVRVTEDGGFEPGEEGLPGMHAQVALDEPLVIPANGKYIYLWVSNESENTKVWFDDIKVTHVTTFVAQATDYGVWGDVLREQKTDESVYRYAYQGQFSERDLETGWTHFELREYDPVVGRWTATDPAGQYWSPYVGMGNDPVNGVDPDGAFKTWAGAALYSLFNGGDIVFNDEEWIVNMVNGADMSTAFDWGSGGGGSFLNGFEAGAHSTWASATSLENIILSTMLPAKWAKEGVDGVVGMVGLGTEVYNNWDNYGANDYAYGAGFVAWKGVEVAIARRISGAGVVRGGLTDLQLVTRAAQNAEAAIGGTGRFAGTAKHTYAKNLLSRYQSIYGDRGLSLGSNYFNGPAGRGFLDVVNHNTKMIYDFKFGKAFMSNAQYLKYSNSFPGYGIRIIKP
jgi:RHS repeat-associated protein